MIVRSAPKQSPHPLRRAAEDPKPPMKARPLLVVAALGLMAALTGCVGYRLGDAQTPPVSSLYILPVANQTTAADLSAPLAIALREAVLARGAMRVANSEDRADGTLEVVLEHFQRSVAATDPRDTALGDSFRIVLSGHATFARSDGTILFQDRPFRAEGAVLVREDLIQAENQAAAVLTRDFAEKVIRALHSSW